MRTVLTRAALALALALGAATVLLAPNAPDAEAQEAAAKQAGAETAGKNEDKTKTIEAATAAKEAKKTEPAKAAREEAKKKTAAVKTGKDEKVCRVKLKYSGEVRTWVCPKEVKCCVWHEINYVKCGTTWGGCL